MPYSSAYWPRGHELLVRADFDELAPSSTTIRSAMRTVENRCETRIVMRPSPSLAVRGGGVALEQRVLGFGVERGGRLVEHQHKRLVAHEAARQRQLLPLAERQSTPSGQVGPSCVSRPARQPRDHVVGAGAVDGGDDGRLVVEARHVAEADGVPRAELEAEEILEGAGQPRAPLVGARCARAVRSSTRIAPTSARTSCASSLTSVVLPAPFSPTMATTAPAGSVERDVVEHEPRSVPG